MKKVYLASGKTTRIQFGEYLVRFVNGIAEVEDNVYEFLKESKYPNVLFSRTDVIKKKVDQIPEEVAPLKDEIVRLKLIIADKDKKIAALNEDLKVWKGEYEILAKQIISKDQSQEEDDLQQKLSTMTVKDLVAFARTQGIEESSLQGLKKAEIIAKIIG